MRNDFSHDSPNFAEKLMKMDKEISNDKMDLDSTKHAIKTKYLNSYKVIVAGGRDFDNYEYLKEKLDETFICLGDLDTHPIEIISGMAKGADTLGIKYAEEHKLTMVLYPANWKKYPRMAGILRNMNMLVTATHLVAFWDGKSHGTKHMIEIAKAKGIPVWIYKY